VSRLPCPGQLSPPQWRDSPTGAETMTNVGRHLLSSSNTHTRTIACFKFRQKYPHDI